MLLNQLILLLSLQKKIVKDNSGIIAFGTTVVCAALAAGLVGFYSFDYNDELEKKKTKRKRRKTG